MRLTVASWNLHCRSCKSRDLALFRSLHCDLIALQEVTSGYHGYLLQSGVFDWGVSSLSIRPPKRTEGASRRLGCSVFGTRRFPVGRMELLTALPFPERSLVVDVALNTGVMTFASIHVPPGASWGEMKPETFRLVAKWLCEVDNPCVIGLDANSPKTDHPTHGENEWWYDEEALLLGERPAHRLRDVLRTCLSLDENAMRRIARARPHGPLAISHVRGNGRVMTPSRYDFILASPDFRVLDVRHLRKEATACGSDHALVVAVLEAAAPSASWRSGTRGRPRGGSRSGR